MEQLELFDKTKDGRVGIYLDHDTVDKVTVMRLKDYLDTLETVLRNHRENNDWLHPDDIPHTERTIDAIKIVLRDFGEDT